MNEDQYGHLAFLNGTVGKRYDDRTYDFYFYILNHDRKEVYVSRRVKSKYISWGRLKVVICDREHSDTETRIILPDGNHTVVVVQDESLKIKNISLSQIISSYE